MNDEGSALPNPPGRSSDSQSVNKTTGDASASSQRPSERSQDGIRRRSGSPSKPKSGGKSQGATKKPNGKPKTSKRPPGALELKALGGNRYAFHAPDCAVDRALDLDEVREMRLENEGEIARDELLYLVADCRGFLEAYLQLAELALEEEDIGLAIGHFGFAYETGIEALPPHFKGQLPAKEGYNCHFFAAGRGLARCLVARNENSKAREVLEQLLRFDPVESETRSLLEQLNEREQKK